MKKIGSKIIGAALMNMVAFSMPLYAEISLPYEFTAGQPAKAAEVNANLIALKDEINSAASIQVSDDNGVVGKLLTVRPGIMTILNNSGYIISFEDSDSDISTTEISDFSSVYYESVDCSGQAYARSTMFIGVFGRLGMLNGSLHYIDKAATGSTVNYNSTGFPGSCAASTGSQRVFPLNVNNPLVTGYSGAAGSLKLTK